MSFTQEWNGNRVDLWLPPCSLLCMQDEGRYDWEHSIADRKTDVVDDVVVRRSRRVSITFRKVRRGNPACVCMYERLCDTKALLRPHICTIKQLQKLGAVPNDIRT